MGRKRLQPTLIGSLRFHPWRLLMGVLLLALGGWALYRNGLAQGGDDGASPAADPTSELRSRGVGAPRLEPKGDELPVVGGDRLMQDLPAKGVAVNPDDGSEPSPAEIPPNAQPVWDLVQDLRELARDPAGFHARALPVALELEGACRKSPGLRTDTGNPAGSSSIVGELVRGVVRSEEESPLVRGAVLLGISPLLDQGLFQQVFDTWFRNSIINPEGLAGTSGELLRAAALAGARRGTEMPCALPLLLAQLDPVRTITPTSLPGIYPVRLERLIGSGEAGVLADWFERAGGTGLEMGIEAMGPMTKGLREAVGERYVTSELLFIVWGHRALVDPAVERKVIAEVALSEEEAQEGDLSHLRAAAFLVHALALCSERMGQAADAMAASPNPLIGALAQSMEGVGAGGMGAALIAKLESLRFSRESRDRSELTMTLLGAQEKLQAMAGGDPEELELLAEYLAGIAADPTLSGTDRAFSVSALESGGSWDVLLDSVRSILAPPAPSFLFVVTTDALMQQAGADSERRAQARRALESLLEGETRPQCRSVLQGAILELSG